MNVFRMSGAGNNFAVADVRNLETDLKELAVSLCKQLDTDGFLGLDHSSVADFKLHFYNADGLRGEMCGNGARCICKFAYDIGLAGEHMTVETDAGLVYGKRIGEECYVVQLNLPSVVDLHRREDCAYVELGKPGVPHGITRFPGLDWDMKEALRAQGKALRYAPEFPKGANISFYTVLSPGCARILTYERGVEDFTLACGTGSASLAVVLWKKGLLPGGVLRVENPGGTLVVTLETTDREITAHYLQGPAITEKTEEK